MEKDSPPESMCGTQHRVSIAFSDARTHGGKHLRQRRLMTITKATMMTTIVALHPCSQLLLDLRL